MVNESEQGRLVKRSTGVGGINRTFCSQTFCGIWRNWLIFLRNEQDLSHFLWEWVGLVKRSVGMVGIGKNFCLTG